MTGRVLAGRYRLTRLIATGGMAQVWEAEDDVLARPVAVKLLHPHLAADPGFVDRFRHEAIAAARLSHPSIVSIYDTVSDEGLEAIVMELVRGVTLRARLDSIRSLEVPDAVAAGSQVADALEVAHRAHVVHRDIKPGNILLNADGRVMVADFGIAKAMQAGDRTAEGTMLGTAKYLAPEQVEGAPVDARTDLYSLAVVLYECICGRPPFLADTDAATALARLHQTPLRPRQIKASVPKAVEEVVLRGMALRPDDRFPSAAEFRAALLASLHGKVPETLASGPAGASASANVPRTLVASRPEPSDTASHRPTAANIPAPLVPPKRPRSDPPTPPRLPITPPDLALGPDRQPPRAAQPVHNRTRRPVVPALVALLVVVAAIVAGVLISNSSGSKKGGLGTPSTSASGLQAVAATSYDPLGDGNERQQDAGNAIDANPGTVWSTEHYNTSAFGGLKSGLGIYVTLSGSRSLRQVQVISPDAGWSTQIYVANAPPTSPFTGLSPFWGNAVAASDAVNAGTSTFNLKGATGKVVLIWITKLPESGVLRIGDIKVLA